MTRVWWILGVVALVVAVPLASFVAGALPLGYDFRAYWLAAQHIMAGTPVYQPEGAVLGQPDEFHYLPVVAVPFIVTLLMPLDVAIRVWFVSQIALAAALGVWLVRAVPGAARPWAAAGYVFFLPMVLEVTLGNVDLICLVLALAAWGWRSKPNLAVAPYAASVGIKFLMLSLVPFYLAAGYVKIVIRAFVLGAVVLVASSAILREPTAEFVALLPRYLDTAWVRLHADREDPAWLATIAWSDQFPLVLALAAVALAVAFGRAARRDRAREGDWHALALALSPYITPFGFVWTTFIICSLPLFVVALRKALLLAPAARAATLVALAACWLGMQMVQLRELWPLVAHGLGVFGLIAITLALLAAESRQMLGRSIPAVRATRAASG